MGPIDYTIDSVDPISGMLEGLKAGTEIRQFQEARTLEEQQKERINQYRDSMTDYMQNPTIDKLRNLQATFPEQDKAFKPLLDQMDKKQLQAEQSAGTQIISAIKQNDLGTAHKVLDLAIESGKNSGIDTSSFEMVKQSLDQNPTGSLGVAQWMLYHTMSPEQQEKFAKAQQMIEETSQSEKLFPSKLREQTAKAGTAESEATIKGAEAISAPERYKGEASKATSEAIKSKVEAKFAPLVEQGKVNLNRAQISNISSQISDRSKRFNLDAQKVSLEVAEKLQKLQNKTTNLSPASLKMVNDSAVNASISKQSATEMDNLAKKLDGIQGWGKYAGGATEFLKAATGQQDPTTMIKKEYVRLRNSVAIKSLPPGPATDRDIELALRGMPDEHANPKELASFMRGMAKMQKISATVEDAKGDWITETGGSLGRSRGEFVAGGYKVKPGQSFGDFSQSVVKAIAQKETKKERAGTTGLNVPSPKVPTKKTKKLFEEADAIIYGGR